MGEGGSGKGRSGTEKLTECKGELIGEKKPIANSG